MPEAHQADDMEVDREESKTESAVKRAEAAEGVGEGSETEPQAKMEEEEEEGSGPAAGQEEAVAEESKEGEEESAVPRAEEDAGDAAASDALQAQASGDQGGFASFPCQHRSFLCPSPLLLTLRACMRAPPDVQMLMRILPVMQRVQRLRLRRRRV